MANTYKVTKADGTVVYRRTSGGGTSTATRSDYVKAQEEKAKDYNRNTSKRSGARAEVIGGEIKLITAKEAPIVARDKTGKGYTTTDLRIEQNKSLLQAQPKGSYKVTKADGTVVYRTSGVNAQGRYVNDVYQRLQEEKNVDVVQSQYNTIPKSAYKVSTNEGDVFRTTLKQGDKNFITDYKPGGIKTTKVQTKTFIGGSSQFLPTPDKKKGSVYALPPTPLIDFSLSQKPLTAKAGSGYEARIKKLLEREDNLARTKSKVYDTLRITGKPDAKFYNLFEIGKAVARVPFEIASLPVYLGGRASFITESIFQPAGRQELLRGFKATPSAVRSVFITKDADTGKYKITAQNVANIGLTALSVRSVAKSPSNQGLKVYEKYAKTDIKGTIKGYQGTTIFKSSGKLSGRPYQELTVFKGKSSTSTIQYQGKTFIINRNAKGGGTYKIVQPKTRLSFSRQGPIIKRVNFVKDTVVLQKGSFKASGQPIKFETSKGVTTQDIRFLDQRALSKTYINYLEQLKTQAKGSGQFKSGSQNLKFDAKANVKVNADLSGTVTNQKVFIDKVDFSKPQTTLTRQFNKPKIEFADKSIKPKDVVIAKVLKEGNAITGFEKGFIQQPKHVLIGPKDAFVSGQFTITGGKGFNVFKNILKPKTIKTDYYIVDKTGFPLTTEKFLSEKSAINTIKKNDWGQLGAKIKKDGVIYSAYKSKVQPLNKQIPLTEEALIYNIPFQAQAPQLKFETFNFDVLNAPLGNVKAVPLVPTVTPITETPFKTLNIFKPILKEPIPASKVKTFQEVRPVNAFKVTSVYAQIQNQKPVTDIKVEQRGRSSNIQKPKTIVEQVQSQTQISAQIQSQKQVAKQQQVFNSVFKQSPVTPTFNFPEPFKFQVPKIGGFPRFDLGSKPTSKGFNVLTRIKGVFKQANIKPLSKTDAINFGTYRVGNTSQATFKITEANEEVQDVFRGKGNLADFYKKDDLFIEKRGRRIKSIGELQEITFKGIQSQKTKNIFGGKK